MLDEAGLVRTEKNRGVFVRDMSVDEATEIFDLRAAMEEMVGRHLATHITTAQLQGLETFLTAMQQAVDTDNLDAYHQLNLAFHDRLVELTGNRRLIAIYRKLIKELSLFRRRNLSDAGALPLSVQGHRHMVDAIASGNAADAGLALANHVWGSKQRMLGNMAAGEAPRHTAATSEDHTALVSNEGL
jgi:DNA-binding GntR family transcriptional regulator